MHLKTLTSITKALPLEPVPIHEKLTPALVKVTQSFSCHGLKFVEMAKKLCKGDVQVGQVFVGAARRAGRGTEAEYRECPAEIGTVGSYVIGNCIMGMSGLMTVDSLHP